MDKQPSKIVDQAFVIRIWLEETAAEAGELKWRGRITHVPTGNQRYVESLNDIELFIGSYLQLMGVNEGAPEQ